MDLFSNVLTYFIAGLIVFSFILWIGFWIPPRPRRPSITPGQPALPLEGLIKQEKNPLLKEEVIISTSQCIAWGNGRTVVGKFPFFGPMWSAFSWTLYLDPGNAFVIRTRITWFGRAILFGGDQYVNGIGKFIMGESTLENDHISRSEFTMLWLYSFLFAPDTLRSHPDVRQIEAVANDQTWIIQKGELQPAKFVIKYAADAFTLVKIETTRTTGKLGTDLPFNMLVSKHLNPTLTTVLPARITVSWENDPYMVLDLKGYHPGVDISSEIAAGV